MSALRYKEVYQQMIDNNKKDFQEFEKLHDEYALNPDNLQDQFNKEGKKIQEIIRKYEDILCGHSERSGYASYSGNLAEKFQNEVRKHFPKIDYIGVKITQNSPSTNFNIRKINL